MKDFKLEKLDYSGINNNKNIMMMIMYYKKVWVLKHPFLPVT